MVQRTKIDPSIKVLTVGALLFIVSSIGYYFYHHSPQMGKEKAEEVEIQTLFDFGTIENSMYCNDFFKFKILVPRGYEAEYHQYMLSQEQSDVVTPLDKKDTLPIQPVPKTTATDKNLLLLQPEVQNIKELVKTEKDVNIWFETLQEKSRREQFGVDHQLAISVHSLKNSSLQAYINLFENLHHPNYGIPKTTMLDGVPFKEYHGMESRNGAVQETAFRMLGGKNKHIISYFAEINGFALCIDLFYETEAQKHKLQEILNGLQFF